jgi:hypothetical protein
MNTSNAKFDLNISNYTQPELEQLLDLPSNYDEGVVEMQETKLRQNIMNDKSIVPNIKTQTLNFISEVKKTLIVNIMGGGGSGGGSKPNILNEVAAISKKYYNFDKGLTKSDLVSSGSTFIIDKPVTPYGQSQPSEFYQGAINPLNKRTLRQNINIDTRFRENYYTTPATNFHLDLPIRLTQVVSLQLSALEMPTTFYAVSGVFGNNFFVLEIAGSQPLTVTIPDGNYSYLTLQNYINHFLTNQTINTDTNYNKIRFLSDINTPNGAGSGGTGKMVVGYDSTAPANPPNFVINFQTDRYGNEDRQTPLPLKLGWLMGFREGYYQNNLAYVSEGVIDLTGPKYIYLVIDDFNNSVNDGFYGAFTSSVLNKNILARISLQGSVFSTFTQNNLLLVTTSRQYFGPVDIQKIQVQLLDEYGRILNLNNMDYSFCLTFQTIYNL